MSKQKNPNSKNPKNPTEDENIEVVVEDEELPALEEEADVVVDPMEQKENEIAALKEELNQAKNDIARDRKSVV